MSADRYAPEALRTLQRVIELNRAEVADAARLVADCVAAGGVIQAFGTGHSQVLAAEIAGRAGGLIPTNRLSLADPVLYGGADLSLLSDPLLERAPGTAATIYDLAAPHPEDLFVIISNSGVNNSVVDLALLVRDRGHQLIAITSREHSMAVPALHESGKRLLDLATVVMDNGAPLGDALIDGGGGIRVCGVSTLTSSMLIQMTVAEAIGLLAEDGIDPPVYVSANVPGGHERNLVLEGRYGERLRRSAL
ncbi:MAG: SIS domain-containing protein [Streptosporangiaceae bacterium]